MAEKLSVICDVHRRDHPATHLGVIVDMCDDAYAKHQARIADLDRTHSNRDAMEQDNQTILDRVVVDPGQGRAHYAEVMDWETIRASYALNRLRHQGLVRAKGRAQAAVWFPTAAGKKY